MYILLYLLLFSAYEKAKGVIIFGIEEMFAMNRLFTIDFNTFICS